MAGKRAAGSRTGRTAAPAATTSGDQIHARYTVPFRVQVRYIPLLNRGTAFSNGGAALFLVKKANGAIVWRDGLSGVDGEAGDLPAAFPLAGADALFFTAVFASTDETVRPFALADFDLAVIGLSP